MNRDDIIRMAREAKLLGEVNGWNVWYPDELERFAQLVAKHTLMNVDPSSFMSYQEGFEAGAAAEREACAKECEKYMEIFPDFGEYCKGGINGLTSAAKAIRARGQK